MQRVQGVLPRKRGGVFRQLEQTEALLAPKLVHIVPNSTLYLGLRLDIMIRVEMWD